MNTELEVAIDKVGREKVFDKARSYGWRAGEPAPEWIWWGIVRELQEAGAFNELWNVKGNA